MGPFVFLGFFFVLAVLLIIGLYKNGKEHPEIGTVEIVEIDGKYAVRQYGYYAGYGKAMQVDIDKGKKPFADGLFQWRYANGMTRTIHFDKEPEWSYLDKYGHSTGFLVGARKPASDCLWSYENAERIANKVKQCADYLRKELDAKNRKKATQEDWSNKCMKAKSVKRL